MTTKLGLYNDALLICGERFISSLTESREPRYLLDHAYDQGAVDDCLENGFWPFATRSVQLDYDASEDPSFGYGYAFSKPSDWVSTIGVCSDEFFNVPLTQHTFENELWYADITPIYLKYVSNDTSYGYNLAIWPTSFKDYVATYLASKIVPKLADEPKVKEVMDELKKAKLNALNNAGQSLPTSFPAQGSWVRSRQSGRRNDRGHRNTLIG